MTVNGNQGLEALAALCGGQSEAPTENGGQSQAIIQPNHGQVAPTPTPAQMQQMLQAAVNGAGMPSATQHSALNMFTQQQWQQAIAATAALQRGGLESVTRGLLATAVGAQSSKDQEQQPQPQQSQPQQQQQQQQQQANQPPYPMLTDASTLAAMQQLAYYQYMAAAQKAAAGITGNNASVSLVDPSQALALALSGKTHSGGNAHQNQTHQKDHGHAEPVVPPSPMGPHPGMMSAQTNPTSVSVSSNGANSMQVDMKPPPALSMSKPAQGINPPGSHASIAPMPSESGTRKQMLRGIDCGEDGQSFSTDDKKQQKRAANRRSAQLSRKRKKQFIEELKEENDELRRKEQILRSIPDLVVVFDSSGRLWFVSQSVTRFLQMTPQELEGTSFWDRLCEDSVRLLKAAFMDSLAARKNDSDTAPLGSGVWELRLVDRDGTQKIVTLNGVVHFSGEAPECVCCIRPRDSQPSVPLAQKSNKVAKQISAAAVSSSSDGSQGSSGDRTQGLPELTVKPNQSVMNSASSSSSSDQAEADTNEGSDETADETADEEHELGKIRGEKSRESIRISDGDTGSLASDSGSGSDELCT